MYCLWLWLKVRNISTISCLGDDSTQSIDATSAATAVVTSALSAAETTATTDFVPLSVKDNLLFALRYEPLAAILRPYDKL